eukprot:4515891-Amphidinium_carterae.1
MQLPPTMLKVIFFPLPAFCGHSNIGQQSQSAPAISACATNCPKATSSAEHVHTGRPRLCMCTCERDQDPATYMASSIIIQLSVRIWTLELTLSGHQMRAHPDQEPHPHRHPPSSIGQDPTTLLTPTCWFRFQGRTVQVDV